MPPLFTLPHPSSTANPLSNPLPFPLPPSLQAPTLGLLIASFASNGAARPGSNAVPPTNGLSGQQMPRFQGTKPLADGSGGERMHSRLSHIATRSLSQIIFNGIFLPWLIAATVSPVST